MNKTVIAVLLCFLCACAVKIPVENTYKLETFSTVLCHEKQAAASIQVSQPVAATGFNTEQMLYTTKPFELSPFVKNAWTGDPASMLFPLIIQSLQASGYFFAVTSVPYSDVADYRIDTQLLALRQNFMLKPSVLDMVVKNVLTSNNNNQVIASRIFTYHMPCPSEAPYGGVLAANKATKLYTAQLTDFIINTIKHNTQQTLAIAKNKK